MEDVREATKLVGPCRDLFGIHRFEARVERVEKQTQNGDDQTIWETTNTYVRDVCAKCGATVERAALAASEPQP